MPSSRFKPETLPDLKGRIYLVTGGNAGIGKATVATLASKHARVYTAARSETKALAAIHEIKQELPDADIRFLELDLMDLESVVRAAEKYLEIENQLHGLINNAGIMAVPFELTKDGYESQFQTNYLSHYLLTARLLPILLSTASSSEPGTVRIINVASDGHERFAPKPGGIAFDDINLPNELAFTRYGQSKLANVLQAKYLDKLYGPSSSYSESNAALLTAAVHPGHIDTDLNRKATGVAPSSILGVMTPIMRCIGILDQQAKGALSSVWAAASPEFRPENSGAYVVPYAKIGTPSEKARDMDLAERLWKWTEKSLESVVRATTSV